MRRYYQLSYTGIELRWVGDFRAPDKRAAKREDTLPVCRSSKGIRGLGSLLSTDGVLGGDQTRVVGFADRCLNHSATRTFDWRACRDSNPGLPSLELGTLPTELHTL